MPLFGSRTRSPQDLVRSLQESLAQLGRDKGEKETKRASEELTKTLQTMKNMVYASSGDQDTTPSDPVAQLATEMHNQNILPLLVNNLHRIHFEDRKDVVVVFNNLVRKQIGTRSPTVEYICSKPEILLNLVRGYETHEVALNCGQMLRECCRAEELVRIIMNSEDFYKFFHYVELSTFDIASDAFSTFKDIITRHKPMSAQFLEKHYDRFFENYKKLLASDNYVTRRQALKLLGELLLERYNFTVMTRYISNTDNLKVMMTLLKEKSRNIQFEAFHVFKVFVANPNKPQPVVDILLRNRDKLVDFLSKFHSDRSDDEQFNDEKAYLIKQIKDMKPQATTTTPTTTTPTTTSPSSSVDPSLCRRQN